MVFQRVSHLFYKHCADNFINNHLNYEPSTKIQFAIIYILMRNDLEIRKTVFIFYHRSIFQIVVVCYFKLLLYAETSHYCRYLATSQFQPTFARKAFPCFDEPALKARFNVVLLRMSNMTSLSNQPIIRTEKR